MESDRLTESILSLGSDPNVLKVNHDFFILPFVRPRDWHLLGRRGFVHVILSRRFITVLLIVGSEEISKVN